MLINLPIYEKYLFFYNSFDLARKLSDNKTHCTGILQSGRQKIPIDVISAKLKKRETVATYAQGIMTAKWKDRREVLYISNVYNDTMVEMKNKRKEKVSEPLSIVQYNKYIKNADEYIACELITKVPRTFTYQS